MIEYQVNPKVVQERVSDLQYRKIDKAKEPFEVLTSRGKYNLCGNVAAYFKKNKCKLGGFSELGKGYISAWQQMPSCLALYRTISLFQTNALMPDCDYYKMNWSIHLRHKDTGKILGLGEWKGGFNIFTEGMDIKDLPESFIKDCEYLLTVLCSPDMPIGYDGTVAGSVA